MARTRDEILRLYQSTMPDPKPPASPDEQAGHDPNFTWVTLPEEKAYGQLVGVIKRLIMMQAPRLWLNTQLASLYCNEDLTSSGSSSNRLAPGLPRPARSSMPRQTENLIKAYTDTVVGKLMQSNTRVQAMTTGGDWDTYRKARKLNLLLDATRLEGGYGREVSRVAADGVQVGAGYMAVLERKCKVVMERWYYNELFVDPFDAAYGHPTMLFRMRYMKRANVLAHFGHDKDPVKAAELRQRILTAVTAASPSFSWQPYESGMIAVYEAWALPQGEEGTESFRPGRHLLCLENGLLNPGEIEWEFDHFPVVQFRASEMPLGWYGQGFTTHAAGPQVMLNTNLNVMARSMKLGLAPYWVVSGGASVSIKQLNNIEGHVVTSTGPEPKWFANPPFNELAIPYNDTLRNSIRAIYGISDIEAMAAAPQSRYDSDPALMRLQDAWMARHVVLLNNWSEEFHLELNHRILECAQRIAKDEGSYPIIVKKGDRAIALDWKDYVDISRDEYKLHLATESPLPLTMSARIQRVIQLKAEGIITPEAATAAVTGSEDLEALMSTVTAFETYADWVVEELMDGKDVELSEMQNVQITLAKVRAVGLLAIQHDAPHEIQQKFELFTARLTALVQQANQTNMAMMAQQQGVANGGAGSPPSSPGSIPGLTS